MSVSMTERGSWRRWAFVILPAMVMMISIFNFFHRRRHERSEIVVAVVAGLLTLMGVGNLFLGRRNGDDSR